MMVGHVPPAPDAFISVPFRGVVRSLQLMALGLFALLTTLTPRAAYAAESRVVLVLPEARTPAEPLDTHLQGALRGQLRELDVEVGVVRRAEEPLANAAQRAQSIAQAEHALGVIWLELRPDRLSVFLYDSSGHLYARDVTPDGSTVSQSEAIAIILRSAIAAMLEGDAVSMTEVQLPPRSPGPAVAPAAPVGPPTAPTIDRAYLHAGVSYVGSLFARRTAWQHGAALVLRAAPTDSPWFFGLDYAYFPPVELEAGGVRTRVQRHPLEVLGGLRLRVAALYFNVEGALSADYTVRTTEQVSAGLVPAEARGRWLWAASSRLGVTVPISRRVYGVLNVGAEFLLNPFHQVVAETKIVNEVVASPLLVRPRLELGALISVW
jgi:hypothetical protein